MSTTARQSAWCVLLLVVLMTATVRYGLLDVPLERDEGEYAYGGQLILQCMPLYEHLYSMKLPGIYAAYSALILLFGHSHKAIHLGLLLINTATIIVIFLLAKRLINSLTAIIAAACFAVLSIGPSVQGIFANAEHFVILPALSGALLLLKALDEDTPRLMFYSGLLFGLAFLMKQHGALFIAFGGLYLFTDLSFNSSAGNRRSKIHGFLLFCLGAIAPYGLTCLIFFLSGGFKKFWFLTFEYAKTYSSQISLRMAWALFKNSAFPIGRSMFMIWIFVGIGLMALLLDERFRHRSIFIAMFTIFSFFAVCPGFYFRPHYFIMALPAAALLFAVGISSIANILSFVRLREVQYGLSVLAAVFCLAMSVYQQRTFLFQMTPFQASRFTYGFNPFPESLEIGRFIKSHSKKDEHIAVIGSEPQIYFYSERLSASGYIYMYPLMEKQPFALQMQKEMIHEIESIKPKFLIFINIITSWLKGPDSNPLVFEWFNSYRANHYKLVGLADLLNEKTIYYWTPNIKDNPKSPLWIAVFERTD